ncbi:GGDEF domain-containing protein [Thermocrinis jamiesonii]|jgi:diguanylate cyclase (GGDEF) domain|uniref:GGDEF domain-containing protein n=1 Tax=Thermocrinis jamiesonii TaxID=1302351 RepID=UPI0004977C3D|nr:GGDEF domain-containing protein [Thermocrinis jamiesonii]
MNKDIQIKLLQALLDEITKRYDYFIQSQNETIRKTYEIAVKDHLTKLYNRMYLEDYLRRLIKMSKRDKAVFQILFIDLDNFKPINDIYGHEKGDQILKEVADFLRQKFRDYDIIARLGGDEFCVVLEEEIDQDRIEKIREEFEKTFSQYNLSFSYGIANSKELDYSKDEDNIIKDILKLADERMYKQKMQRKGWSFFHQPN